MATMGTSGKWPRWEPVKGGHEGNQWFMQYVQYGGRGGNHGKQLRHRVPVVFSQNGALMCQGKIVKWETGGDGSWSNVNGIDPERGGGGGGAWEGALLGILKSGGTSVSMWRCNSCTRWSKRGGVGLGMGGWGDGGRGCICFDLWSIWAIVKTIERWFNGRTIEIIVCSRLEWT